MAGVTAIDAKLGGPTLSVVEEVILFEVARIVVVPAATLVAKPWLPMVLLIVATAVDDEDQLAVAVRFCVVPLL